MTDNNRSPIEGYPLLEWRREECERCINGVPTPQQFTGALPNKCGHCDGSGYIGDPVAYIAGTDVTTADVLEKWLEGNSFWRIANLYRFKISAADCEMAIRYEYGILSVALQAQNLVE